MRVKAIDRHLSQTVMLDRANRVVLGLSLLAIATLCAACSPTVQKDCDQLWESRAPSADGSWIAVVHQQVCDVGLGSAVDLWVDLGRKGSVRYTVIATPTGEWKNPDAVELSWAGPRLLQISVPNRTTVGIQLSRHEDIAIRVRYRHDNPADRARWLAWMNENLAWVKDSKGHPQPKGPPLPDSDQTATP